MNEHEANARNKKASAIVAYIRHRRIDTATVRALEQPALDGLCVLAGVKLASDQTWVEVLTILDALDKYPVPDDPFEGIT